MSYINGPPNPLLSYICKIWRFMSVLRLPIYATQITHFAEFGSSLGHKITFSPNHTKCTIINSNPNVTKSYKILQKLCHYQLILMLLHRTKSYRNYLQNRMQMVLPSPPSLSIAMERLASLNNLCGVQLGTLVLYVVVLCSSPDPCRHAAQNFFPPSLPPPLEEILALIVKAQIHSPRPNQDKPDY